MSSPRLPRHQEIENRRTRGRHRGTWLAVAVLASVALLGSACTPLETFDLPTLPAHAQCNHEEKEGLTIAAELVTSPHLVQYHFGPDLRKEGYLPVFISFENRGKTNFEIERKNCVVILESGEKLEPASPDEIFLKVRRSTLPAYVFAPLVIPAIWLHGRIEEHNFRAAKTLHEKSLPRTLRIERNDEPLSRVVFFRDPTGTARSARSFSSSVIQLLVEVEGSKPDEGNDNGTPLATPVGATASGSPAETSPTGRVIGRTVTFTVALSEDDA